MEAFMHMDKENGDLCFPPSKASHGLSGLYPSVSQLLGNTKKSNGAQAHRKVLGNVNQHVPTRKTASKQVQKSKRVEGIVRRSEKKYPEIETFIPYDPLDYERFDVPEEHRLSDHCLAGVPLFVTVDDMRSFEALTSLDLSPMENDLIHYDYDAFTPTFEEIMVALPVMCDF